MPDEYQFLHELAVIEFHGTIFVSWYNNRRSELSGYTPIRERRSHDGGKTWTAPMLVAHDPEQKLLYCPPVYAVCDDTLYLLINTMVSADHMHSLEIYHYNEKDETFHLIRSMMLPFKLNTNAVRLTNGKLLLPGRIAEQDGFPNTPAVLISDSGKINAPWRLVRIQKNGGLPDGSKLVHPELSAVVNGNEITMFCRDDERAVPLLYRSSDSGETWTGPIEHDIPFQNSKIYSGTLSDGRNYVIGNIRREITQASSWNRDRLALFLSKPGTTDFMQGLLLRDGDDEKLKLYPQWSYPCAYESNGKLYVVYTMVTEKGNQSSRGAMMSIVDLNRLNQ